MNTTSPNSDSTMGPMIIIGALFFIFGFVTWLNGPLIIYAKLAFNLDTYAKAFMVTTAFYMAYFFLALPSSWILEKTGMKREWRSACLSWLLAPLFLAPSPLSGTTLYHSLGCL